MAVTLQAPSGRGCGTRDIGACYLSFGIGIGGSPIEEFIVDPVLPWPGTFQRGFKIVPSTNGINHVAIFVGESFYASLWTFVEESARFGISRKVPPTFPFHELTPGRSMMFFIHPKAYLRQGDFVLDRDEKQPLEGCKWHKNDLDIWAHNPMDKAGWHPTAKENAPHPCTFAHKDLSCFFHSEDDIEWGKSTENGYPFNIKAPSFEYTGLTPIVPNALKDEKLEGFSPGVFLKVPLTHIEACQKAGKWERAAQKAGFSVEILEY